MFASEQEGVMILGSIGMGMGMGLLGAVTLWLGGHAPATVLLAYSVVGSLGTLLMGGVVAMRKHLPEHFRG